MNTTPITREITRVALHHYRSWIAYSDRLAALRSAAKAFTEEGISHNLPEARAARCRLKECLLGKRAEYNFVTSEWSDNVKFALELWEGDANGLADDWNLA